MRTKTYFSAMLGFSHFSSSEHTGYRFGFNGMEKDDEVKGNGNSLDFGARIQDPRVGRFLSLDPQAREYPMLSDYSFVANNPLSYVDPDGKVIRFAPGTRSESLFFRIYANADDVTQAYLDKLMDSDVVYNINVSGSMGGPSPGGMTQYNFETGEIDMTIDDVGDNSIEILGDELVHAHQFEIGDLGYVLEDGQTVAIGYDLYDEIASKEGSFRAAQSNDIPLMRNGSTGDYAAKVKGRGMDPGKWIKKFSNANGSYRAIFHDFGQNGGSGDIGGNIYGAQGGVFTANEAFNRNLIQRYAYRRKNTTEDGELKYKTITEETGDTPSLGVPPR